MRKLAAGLLAIPAIAGVYLLFALRSTRGRLAALAVPLLIVAVAVGALSSPLAGSASGPSKSSPLPASALSAPLRSDVGLAQAATLAFDAAPDQAAVQAALSVTPSVDVTLEWSSDGRTLTVHPKSAWGGSTQYTIAIPAGTKLASGGSLGSDVSAVFVTREAASVSIVATDAQDGIISTSSHFAVVMTGPVDPASVSRYLEISPAVAGSFEVSGRLSTDHRVELIPSQPLVAGTSYTVWLGAGVVDTEGVAISLPQPVTFTVPSAPSVVRFRPAAGAKDVDVPGTLSVRFSTPMDETSTASAFSAALADGTAVTGAVTWAEDDTVLVLKPSTAIKAGATVTMSVAATATSARGVAISATATATFTVKAASSAGTSTKIPTGGAVGSGNWTAVEAYYLQLMNCTRTGGWVSSSGSCSGYGSGSNKPLMLDAGISSKVARPYAKWEAENNVCDHFALGTPKQRLQAAGYMSGTWGENLGCRSGDPYASVLGSHLYFQSEKSTNGGHWVNIMNPDFDRAGIGVWAVGSRVRLVVDFYHP